MLNTNHDDDEPVTSTLLEILPKYDSSEEELAMLDLYSGCGGMSTGLCLGAKLASINLVTVNLNISLSIFFLVSLIFILSINIPLIFRNGLLITIALHATA